MASDPISLEAKTDRELWLLTASKVNEMAEIFQTHIITQQRLCDERHSDNHKPWGTLTGVVTGLAALGWLLFDKVSGK